MIAIATMKGGPLAPQIGGTVIFRDVPEGVEVCANISGLPPYQLAQGDKPQIGPHGFHIHQKGNCEVGDTANPFAATGEHWNPTNQPHGRL